MARSAGLTLRGRMTGVYLTSFLISGAILLSIVYLLVRQTLMTRLGDGRLAAQRPSAYWPSDGLRPLTSTEIRAFMERFAAAALQDLLFWSAVALVGLATISVAVGWLVAGRMLRPLTRISATAQRLSSENLQERIGLQGPRDELTELAGAFDHMLDRLQSAFDSQRRFVANASHELRTPLAIQRTAIQVGLHDNGSTGLAEVREQLLEANRRAERLIDALMLLARSERGLEHSQPVRLDEIVPEVLVRYAPATEERRLTTRLDTEPVTVLGDSVLLSHLIANLVDNAIKYNTDGGIVAIQVGPTGLWVSNTGATIAPGQLPGLFEPFERGTAHTSAATGSGLGLSIVRSIVQAHSGCLDVRPRPGGGLLIVARFPPTPANHAGGTQHPAVPVLPAPPAKGDGSSR